MRYGSLFTGVGMLDVGLHLAGLTDLRWVCESDDWRREEVLARRFPTAVRHADVRAVGADTAESVDLIAGGFPCKGASTAGKRGGFDHPETVLWREMFRAIGELGPRYVLIENVANLLSIANGAVWGEVLGDLASLGFDVEWDCIPAGAVGAPHLRDRVFAVATHAASVRAGEPPDGAHAIAGEREARAKPVGRGGAAPTHAERGGRPALSIEQWQSHGAGQAGSATSCGGGVAPSSHPGRDGVRQQSEPERGGDGAPVAGRADAAAADATRHGEGGPEAPSGANGQRTGARAGVPVEWGDYAPAIRRWEAIHGPAPKPLVRRLDDGDTKLRRVRSRVDRSRLSALGDGVQVQVGMIVGAYILELDARHGS